MQDVIDHLFVFYLVLSTEIDQMRRDFRDIESTNYALLSYLFLSIFFSRLIDLRSLSGILTNLVSFINKEKTRGLEVQGLAMKKKKEKPCRIFSSILRKDIRQLSR